MIKINKYDFVTNSDLRSYPDGMDVQIFKRSILNEISKNKLTKLEKEHVTLSIRRRKNKYKFFNLVAPKNLYWPERAVTLDEINDYYFLKEIVKKFSNNLRMISCEDIINIIRKKKKLLKLNNYIIRKEIIENNIGVIIEARLNSSRLPNKHLKVILDIPLIVHLFTRLKKVKNISKIILATTDSKRDDKLENLANKISITEEKSIM